MGRGRIFSPNHRKKDVEFCLKIYNLWFGLPWIIITVNGRQYDNPKFKKFSFKFHIDHRLTSIGHPQSNDEAKVTNRTILHGLKIRLTDVKGW